jgi:hypothetical protein
VLELNTEETTRKFFQNGPGNFDTVFLAHSTSSVCLKRRHSAYGRPAGKRSRPDAGSLQRGNV